MKNIKQRFMMSLLVLAISTQVYADFREHGEHGHFAGPNRYSRIGEIHNFHTHDIDVWRGGHWEHGFHDGRMGWWWFAGGLWYYYSVPVYPYPDPYVPSAVIVQNPAPEVYIEQGQAQPQNLTPPPSQPTGVATTWYYCQNPAGYYPYVTQCPTPWQAVPATPDVPPVRP
jgi:hypothetical protein